MSNWILLLFAVVFVALAPAAGCIFAGIDRKISARMQGRQGPPILQPLYDVRKLLAKERRTSNRVQDFYVACYLFWIVVTGAMFFAGMDLLLIVFTLTLGETFLVLAAYCSGSPFAQVGAQREIYVAMAYEPMILIMAVAYYLFTGGEDGGSFAVRDIAGFGDMAILPMLGIGGVFGTAAIDGRLVSLVTLVMIPAIILALALGIRRRNPFLGESSNGMGALTAAPLLLAAPLAMLQLWMGSAPDVALLLSVGPAAAVTAILAYHDHREDVRRRGCEQGLRDSVFEMGNRMLSGGSFETVCLESLGGRPECSHVREGLRRELALCRGDIGSAIEAAIGGTSREVSRAFRDISACSEEDNGHVQIAEMTCDHSMRIFSCGHSPEKFPDAGKIRHGLHKGEQDD